MKIAANAFWLATCRVAADVAGFILFAAVSRQFGPAGAGEYAYAFAIAGCAAVLGTSGLEEYGIREYVRLPVAAARRRLWTDLLATQAVQLTAGLAALGLFLLVVGHEGAGAPAILATSAYLVGWGVARTLFVPAFAAQAMVVPAFAELLCRLAATATALLLLASLTAATASLPLVLIGFPAAGLTLAVLALLNARRHGAALEAGRLRRPAVGGTLRQSWPFAVSEMLSQFYVRADLLMIAHLVGSATAGLYATGVKFVEVGLVPFVLLGQAAYPFLSRVAGDDPRAFADAASDLLRTVLLFAGLLALGLRFVAPPLVPLLLGAEFGPASELLPWFGALAVLKAAEIALYRLLYAARLQGTYLRALVLGTSVNVTLNLALIPALGALGAILAASGSALAIGFVCGFGLRRQLPPRHAGRAILALAAALLPSLGAGEAVAALAAAPPWAPAAAACLLYALLAPAVGLVPDPRRTLLLGGGTAAGAGAGSPG